MFSKENRRFLTLIAAMVVIVLGTIFAIVSLVNKEHGKDSVLVTGFVGILLAQLVSMLRAEQERMTAFEKNEDLRNKVDSAAIHARAAVEVAEETKKETIESVKQAVVEAETRPAPGMEAMPKTPEELREFLMAHAHTIAHEVCDNLAQSAARYAAEAVRDALHDAPEVNKTNGTKGSNFPPRNDPK